MALAPLITTPVEVFSEALQTLAMLEDSVPARVEDSVQEERRVVSALAPLATTPAVVFSVRTSLPVDSARPQPLAVLAPVIQAALSAAQPILAVLEVAAQL